MKQGWEIKKLGEIICEHSVRNKQDYDYPVYSVTNSAGFCRDYFSKEVASKDKKTYKIVPKGYFAYNPSRINVGSVDWQRHEDNVIVSPLYVVFGTDDTICQDYLLYYLKSSSTMALIQNHATGTVRANLKFDILSQFAISLPPIAEQKKIVYELDCISGIIEKKKQQLKELDNLAQSIFYEMFGDPVENDNGWEVKRLDEIGEIIAGSTPSTADDTNWDGDINWVTPAELDVQLYYGETVRKITEKAAKSLTLMPVGTVLLSTRAPIGKIAITTVPMYCNQGFKNIICNECINNVFLYYYLMLTMDNIKALGRGATFKEVSKKNISEYKVIIPDLDKQKQFASKIESIEKQKELIAQSIKETETLFNSRMDYYFN